ncbi:MAG: LysR family transcriptional regulator [Roseitalea sp.]|nr:LysR family transcriptional regulator [Roseitalea sp.]MBO6720793.1 LysR family transcriptional regulator [Roseitalea sp.]MBO6743940.1 LysR family transcriptional regulator [Roseitalea sp.]
MRTKDRNETRYRKRNKVKHCVSFTKRRNTHAPACTKDEMVHFGLSPERAQKGWNTQMPLGERVSVDDLRLFFLLHEAGGITAAARRFGVPKATLSRALGRLEQIAETPLFDRVSNGLKLTQAGESLIESADAVTRAGAAAEEILRSAHGDPSGVLRIAASALQAEQLLGPALVRLNDRFPDVEPSVRVTGLGPDPLAEDLDVVLRLGRPEEPYLIARKIVGGALRLYVPSSLGDHVDLDDAKAVEDLGRVVIDVPGAPHEWYLSHPDGRTLAMTSRPKCSVGDPIVALGVLTAGAGLTFLPSVYGEPKVEAGQFLRALPGFEGPRVEVFASFPPRRASVPAVRAFLDVLLEVAKEMPH